MYAGFQNVSGDYVAVMDADLQDDVQAIGFTARRGTTVTSIQADVERVVRQAHLLAPDDGQALHVFNLETLFQMIDNLFRGIRRFFPEHELPHPMKLPLLLKNDLSPEEIVFYSRRLRNYPELRIVPVIRRVVVGTPEIQSQIGKTALNDAGEAVGVSGLEREYDLELSGTSGRMTVMLDRNGNWCYDTLRITRQAKNGEDIRADFELPPETDASKELPEDEKD